MKTLLTLTVAVIVSRGVAAAQSPLTQFGQVTSGVVGITPGQTARFNLLYPTVPAPVLQIVCSATLIFADDQGKVLKTTNVSPLIAGRSVSLDLNADTDLAGRARTQIHAFSTEPSGCIFTGTVELIDNATQKTVLVVAARKTYPPNAEIAPSQGGSGMPEFSPLPIVGIVNSVSARMRDPVAGCGLKIEGTSMIRTCQVVAGRPVTPRTATAKRYVWSNPRMAKGNFIEADLDAAGALTITVKSHGPDELRVGGSQMLDDVFDHFGADKIREFDAKWVRNSTFRDNYDEYVQNLQRDMKPEEAAWNTWTDS